MRGRLLILLGVILALVSGFMVFRLLSSRPAAEKVPEKIETRKVIVAVQNLPKGAKIVPEAVTIMEKPLDEVPDGALVSVSQTRGKLAAVDIYQGDVITKDMIKSWAEVVVEKPASLIPIGKVAFTIKVDELSAVAYNIQPGDRVDVLVSLSLVDVEQDTQIVRTGPEGQEQVPRHVTQLTLQGVEVLNVGLKGQAVAAPAGEGEETGAAPSQQAEQEGEQPTPYTYSYITLLLPQQDAQVLKYLREIGARVDLALRNPEDTAQVSTEPVTLEYVMRRFRFIEPTKLPYVYQTGPFGLGGE